ncbi:MAG: acetyl-CoA carboxylase biotin carboxyl carrier protein subunit, partial [Bacteroidota bacterium]
ADAEALDIRPLGDHRYHILHRGQSLTVTLQSADYANKSFRFRINGHNFDVKVADHFDLLVDKMGLSVASGQKVKDVKAPMPGLVLDINVSAGQEVEAGEGLLILEAMKMENVIKSVGEGQIKAIHIEKGQTVDKGQLLIEMQ